MENKTKILNVQPPFNNLELCDTKLLSLWANDKLIQKKGGGESNPKDFLLTIFSFVEKANLTVANIFDANGRNWFKLL